MTLLIVIIIALILYVILAYNTFVKMRNRVKEAWSDIDVQLKRRYNLIPNIIETVKGYAAHEEGVFTKVTEARAQAINATNVKDQGVAENMLSGALKSLFAVAENYPDLKANENFMQLQNELVDTEDKIQSARRFYNGVVRDFNTKVQQFPAKIIAGIFKFMAEEFFEIDNEEEKKNVEVSFQKQVEKQAPAEPAPETPAKEEKPAKPAPETPAPEAPVEEKPVEEAKPAETPAPEAPAEEKPAEETPAEGEKKK
jgi:LemA protein